MWGAGRWPELHWSGALYHFPGPPSSLSTHHSPSSATISHWLWGDSVGCRHWSCLLVCSSVSAPSLEPLPSYPWHPWWTPQPSRPMSQGTSRVLEAGRGWQACGQSKPDCLSLECFLLFCDPRDSLKVLKLKLKEKKNHFLLPSFLCPSFTICSSRMFL